MAKKSLLPHGFKAKAERISLEFRQELNLKPTDPLCGFKLAEYLSIKVYPASHFIKTPADLEKLVGTSTKDRGWSALTMKNKNQETLIIHNHLHGRQRQQSNLMHELAHIICEHEQPETTSVSLLSYMRKYDPKQEEEANCLGAALQISREGLLWALKANMTTEEISTHFNASTEMVTFRINSTGVNRQLSYRRY